MSNVYAIKSGSWSDTTVWNTGVLPTASDDVYANSYTITMNQDTNISSLRNTASGSIVTGGTFLITSSVLITASLVGGSGSCVVFSANSPASASILVNSLNAPNVTNSQTIYHSGSGTLTIRVTGSYNPSGTIGTFLIYNIVGSGVLNHIGGISGNFGTQTFVVASTATTTINILGNAAGGSNVAALDCNGSVTLNITGSITGGGNSGRGLALSTGNPVIGISGSINASTGGPGIIVNSGNPQITVIGNLTSDLNGSNYAINFQSVSGYLKVVGSMTANPNPVVSTSTNCTCIFSGPFICSTSGLLPFSSPKIFLIPTSGSYFEFRDSSTNGSITPPPPATRMLSPGAIVDSPATTNVRSGIVYASGTLTGSLVVPPSQSVAYGIIYDTTTGSAILTAPAIWDTQLNTMITSGSVGERLQNVATVQTTAAQIAAF